MLLLLLACAPAPLEPTCDARVMDAGEVRVRRLPCSDELLSDGEGRRGDWVLESALARFVIRDTPTALTRLGVSGGTLVDAAPVGGYDPLVEAVPMVGDGWLLDAGVETGSDDGSAWVEVTGTAESDGSEVTVRYTLAADSPTLQLSGADGLSVTPRPGLARVGPAIERTTGELLGVDGDIDDAGGTLLFSGATALTVGSRDVVYAALWPDGPEASGVAEGTWVEALDGDTVVARHPISGEAYSGRLPPEADAVRAVRPGYEDGPAVAPGEETRVGESGRVRLRVSDGTGGVRPATLYWQDTPYPTLPGELAATGPGEGTATVYAGPGFELAEIDLSITEDIAVNLTLPWAVTPAVLADLALVTAPDTTERRDDDDILDEAGAAGVEFALLVARDEVSSANPGTSDYVLARTASQSTGVGSPVAWSWSPSSNRAGHGAADSDGLSAEDLLAVMARRDNRTTIVGTDWLAAAPDPLAWLPPPDLVRVTGLDDLAVLTDLYDRWIALPPVGPLTWVEGLDEYAEVDVEAMLLDGRTIATNGPRIVLALDGEGPGAFFEPDGPVELTLRIEAPAHIPLSGAALIGPGGQTLRAWDLAGEGPLHLSWTDTLRDPPDWILAICWGDESAEPYLAEPAWAITGPIWTGRP